MAKVHWDQVSSIAKAHHLESPNESAAAVERFLRFWWCKTFNKPMKDPILGSYTMDELYYEFLRHFYMDPANDPRKDIDAKHAQDEEMEWVKSQMLRHVDQQKSAAPVIQESKKTKKSKGKKKKKLTADAILDIPDISTKFDP